MTADRYKIIGALPSPFSVKMRAILRYRRLPHNWILPTPEVQEETKHVRPPIIPKVQYPDDPPDVWHVDSSPMAYELEARHAERSIIPPDPALGVLSDLLEDFGDEWGTKMMFHYRWQDKDQGGDRDQIGWWMTYPAMGPSDDEALADRTREFYEWQIPLWPVAGIEPQNIPLIEEMYRRILDAWEAVLRDQQFLFGARPSLGDFGFYGQLHQCLMNPASGAIMRERAMRLPGWLALIDDASGVEGEWNDLGAPLCDGVTQLLWLAGAVYLPYLDATAKAIDAGEDRLRITVLDGMIHEQTPIKYHARCLKVLREKVAALSADDQAQLEGLLDGTACWGFLVP